MSRFGSRSRPRGRARMETAGVALALALAGGGLSAQEGGADGDAWWAGLAGAGPGLHLIEVDSIYEIRGRDHDELLREMRRRGPGIDDIGTRFGVHVAQWRWSYTFRTGGGHDRCHVADASVLLRSVIVLPKWVDRAGAPREVGRDWPRFVEALTVHESGHRNRAKEQGVRLWQSLLGLQGDTCEALETVVSEIAMRVVGEGEAAQLEYDRETDHGLRQGAAWPP